MAIMINISVGARVLLAMRPIVSREGALSFAALAQEVLTEDPISGATIVSIAPDIRVLVRMAGPEQGTRRPGSASG